MTDRSKLLSLAEAVEKLTGPDRETDCRIWAATGGLGVPFEDAAMCVPDFGQWIAPNYTASLDAAMTLVPTKPFPELRLGEWWWSVDSLGCDAHVAYENHDAGIPEYSARAATTALALTAACLRAQAEALS